MGNEEYTDSLKQLAWECYWEGYLLGKDVEDTPPISRRTAKSQFERFWERNV